MIGLLNHPRLLPEAELRPIHRTDFRPEGFANLLGRGG